MVVKIPLKPEHVETPAQITGEELFQMGNIGRTELVKGKLVFMPPTGFLHGYVEGRFFRALEAYVERHKLGRVFVGEVGVYTSRNPDTVRGADVAFVSHGRLAQVNSESYLDVAPELIVEVMSPSDAWQEVMEKLEEYFDIGALVVWVADPKKQQVYVYQSLIDVRRFTADDMLPGGEVLPDFSIPVVELFGSE